MRRRTFIKGIVAGISALVVGEKLAAEENPALKLNESREKIISKIREGGRSFWTYPSSSSKRICKSGPTELPDILKAEGIEWVKYKSNVWQFRYAGLIFFAYPCSRLSCIAMALHIPDDKPDYNYAATQLIQKETFWKKETREEICRLLIRDIEIKMGLRRVFNTGSGYQYVT